MPIPKPKKDESHSDFISRCMSNSTMLSEYPDNSQRYAICQSSWDNKGVNNMTTEIFSQKMLDGSTTDKSKAVDNKITVKSFWDSIIDDNKDNKNPDVKFGKSTVYKKDGDMVTVFKSSFEVDVKGIDLENRIVPFMASKYEVDRDGDIVDIESMVVEHFEKNPVINYAHDIWSHDAMPIGQAVKIKRSKNQLKVYIKFDPKEVDEFAEKVFQKVLLKTLRAVSIGFIPDWNEIEHPKDLKVGGREVMRVYRNVELYEISVVPVPSNRSALRTEKSINLDKQPELSPESQPELTNKQIDDDNVKEPVNLTMDEKLTASLIDDMKKELQEIKNEFNQLYEEIKALNKNYETDNVNTLEKEESIYSKILKERQESKSKDDEFYNDIVKEKGIVGSERDHTTDQTDSFDWQDLTD